jgi:peptidoglycan/LPS O-acetylase OafA/YrhL
VLLVGTYHGSTYGRPRGNWFDPLVHPIIGLCVAAAIVALCVGAADRSPVLRSQPLRLAGLISYSLYLWHVPILVYGLKWAGVSAPIGAVDGVVIALVLACCVGVATLSYALVERPFFDRARREPLLLSEDRQPAAAASSPASVPRRSIPATVSGATPAVSRLSTASR